MSERDGNDPQRWLQGAGDAPAEFIALARADQAAGPDPARLARMLDGIAAQVGRPELAQAAPRPVIEGARAGATATVAPYAAGLALIALIGAGVLAIRANAPARSAVTRPLVVQPAAAHTAAPASANASAAAVDAPAAVPADRGAPAPAAVEPPAAVPADRQAVAPSAGTAARKPAIAHRAAAATGATAGDPVAELALLERAQRALRSDPAAALKLAEEHRAQYARGTLAQEREVLAIEALLRLGRQPAAQKRARAFEQRYPGSSHLVRVHDLLRSTQ